MSATASPLSAATSQVMNGVVNGVLAVKPLAQFAKSRARTMMVKRAETIGVQWRQEVQELRSRQSGIEFDAAWEQDLAAMTNPSLTYPDYYTTSFHAYDEGNLGWIPAMEVDVAARAVHARIWPEAGAQGDARLRQSYHDVLMAQLPTAPNAIVDLGCGVGLSTFALQDTFPQAQLTGVDLSPYFVTVAQYKAQQSQNYQSIRWVHAAAEETGLPSGSFDLVSACLMFHELPQSAAIAILQEARRLVRPGGHVAIMDMNPQSEFLKTIPPFVFTLLKSTEPYLDQYFALDLAQTIESAGFTKPTVTFNSPRHRTFIAQYSVN